MKESMPIFNFFFFLKSIVVNQSMSIFNIKMYCCELVMGVWQRRRLRKVRENIVKFRNLRCSNRYARHFKLK